VETKVISTLKLRGYNEDDVREQFEAGDYGEDDFSDYENGQLQQYPMDIIEISEVDDE
jgi:hypothetical protein